MLEHVDKRVELVEALAPAFPHADLQECIAMGGLPEEHVDGDFGLATQIIEADGGQNIDAGLALALGPIGKHLVEPRVGFFREVVGLDDLFGRHDLAEDSLHGIVAAIGAAHHDAEGTAHPRIHFADRIGETLRSPPARQVAGHRSSI